MKKKVGIQHPVLSKKYTDLIDELEQVKQQIANLSSFIQSDDFLQVVDGEYDLIKDHKRILGHHKEILESRIYKLDTTKLTGNNHNGISNLDYAKNIEK